MKNSLHRPRIWTGFSVLAIAAMLTGAAWVHADQSKQSPLANLTPAQQQAIDSANNLSSAFRAVANELLPSVVAIENRPAVAWKSDSKATPSNDPLARENPFKGTPFEDMFKDFGFKMPPMNQPGARRSPMRAGIGSGVVIDESGIILTNNHVVAGGGEVTVRTHDGNEYVASQVWTDPKTDIAVVKIDGAEGLVAATLGDSESVEIGDWVIALGQPFGLESTVTAGIISAKHRGIGITDRENFLQTDAAINPGNSGGPLVSLRGEVIGINTAIHSRSGGNNGIGFAIPSNLAKWVGEQLVTTGAVKRAYLGVGIQPITPALASELSVKPRAGVLVTDVYPDTPASKAGLQSGDVIVSYNGKAVTTPQALQLAVERAKIGEDVTIAVVRDGKELELTSRATEVTQKFAAKADGPTVDSGKRMEGLGIEIAPVDGAVAKKLGIDNTGGVVITMVRDGSPAAEAGLKPGMVIAEVDRKSVGSVAEFEQVMEAVGKDADKNVLLLVRSDKGSRFVVVKMG